MESGMKKALELIRGVARDTDGAALIEYTVLLGIMLVAVIATIVLVGTWITGQWTALQASLP
jgi:pilus assembly protein Flp/PilA